LTLGEAALLAGLLRAPNKQQPFRYPENAETRRDIVLGQMFDNDFISQEELDAARAESVADSVITPEERDLYIDTKDNRWTPNKFKAPYFVEDARKFISNPPAPYEVSATQEELFEGGLQIYTTVDLRLQKAGERILNEALDAFDEEKLKKLTRQGKEAEFIPVSGALICLDNRVDLVGGTYDYRGYIRAMVGGRDFDTKKFNNATQAKRQPGSGVKPFVWLTALDNGMTPSDYVVDERVRYLDAVGNVYEPSNFKNEFRGPIPMRLGLELSKNIISVKIADRMGTSLIASYMRSAGFKLPINPGLSMALGASDTRIIDQAEAYSTLANGGIHIPTTMVTQIRDRDGIIRYDAKDFRKIERVFPADVSYQIVHLMQGVCEPNSRPNQPSGWRTERLKRPRAGKTGTSNRNRNAWFNGITPQYTCIVWMGYEDNRPLGTTRLGFTGGHLVSPIWTDFMLEAHQGLPVEDFKVPQGVEFYPIDRVTGLAGGDYMEAYIRGTKPPVNPPIMEEAGDLEQLFEDFSD
jgi:penicillin-binding protein 1A